METRPSAADPELADSSGVPSDVSPDLLRRVHLIIQECTRRRQAGELLTDEGLLAAHPDAELQAELKQALAHLKLVERAFAAARTPSRIETIRELVRNCFQRRWAGEVLTDEVVIAGHSDLLPELAAELAKLHKLEAAWQAAEHVEDDGLPHAATAEAEQALCVRCPHCHTPTPVFVADSLTDIVCSSCGTNFSLVDTDDDVDSLDGVDRLGRFELIEQLGVGGFGAVWKAHDPELGRLVAVKIPRRGQLTATETEKFFREARGCPVAAPACRQHL